jgi:hypothetical protein
MALELYQIHSPIRRRVLVLFADRLTKQFDFEDTGLVRKRLLGDEYAAIGIERIYKSDRERTRRSEPSPAGNIRDGGDLDSRIDALHSQSLPQDRMLNLVNAIDQLGARVFQVIFGRVKKRMNDDEAVLRNGAGQHSSAPLTIERRDVRAPAGKAYAKGRAGYYHE